MAQKLKTKELVNTKLANNYGGWIYCGSCNQTIGYLCYVTYQSVKFEYRCKCGNCGSMRLEMSDGIEPIVSSKPLITIKNRLCCPEEEAPLITILQQKLQNSSCNIICKNCNHQYSC
jgi:hypothetical protein